VKVGEARVGGGMNRVAETACAAAAGRARTRKGPPRQDGTGL